MQKEKLIERVKEIHNGFYDYSLMPDVVLTSDDVQIICPIHGVFTMKVKNHFYTHYSGCKECHNLRKAESNKNRFLDKFFEIVTERHPNLDFSKSVPTGYYEEVTVTCPVHGDYISSPNNLYDGHGCKKCADGKAGLKRASLDVKEVEEALKKFSHISPVDINPYQKGRSKVKCEKHGEFTVANKSILHSKEICQQCRYETSGQKQRLTTEEFIVKAKKRHGDTYDYSLVDYQTTRNKVQIICKKHGEFWQKPNSHLGGKGCPVCAESKGERVIRLFLDEHGIAYEQQKKFPDLVYVLPLRFDFFIEHLNMAIEFDGPQHFEEFDWIDVPLKTIKMRDKIKNEYCQQKGINLLRIPYYKNIKQILKDHLC